jgi:hypothetical protein
MRFRTVLVVALVLLPTLLFAQTKRKKKTVPAVFNTARYVYVQAEDGDAFTPGLLPEDRQAIADVQDALRDWNRYVLTVKPDEADLVFYVRKGRIASGRLGGTVGSPGGPGAPGTASPFPGQPRPTGPGTMAGAEAGPPEDLLEVKTRNPDGGTGTTVWERSQSDGLNGPQVPLLRALRDAVERDWPQ